MIVTFKNKELQKFFLNGDGAKIQQSHIKKLRLILARLNTAISILDMHLPGLGLHKLKGNKKEFWSISINKNWRLIFRFKNENVYDVDYLDYH